MQNKMIIIAGYPAAGKSTLARAMSKVLGIPCFTKDRVIETICADFMVESVKARKQLSIVAVRLLMEMAETLLRCGQPVILEANFKPEEAARMNALLKRHACDALLFMLTGDVEVLYKRFMRRESSPSRHSVHKWKAYESAEAFGHAIRPLAGFHVGTERIDVDATNIARVSTASLVQRADAFISRGAQ